MTDRGNRTSEGLDQQTAKKVDFYTRQYIDRTPYWYFIQNLALFGVGLPLGVAMVLGWLYVAVRASLSDWVARLRDEAGDEFREKVTAFRPGIAVHGRYKEPCPRCGEKIQRIRYADNETNYCAQCQTGGKVLADRGLSRLLGADWPRSLDELEALKRR